MIRVKIVGWRRRPPHGARGGRHPDPGQKSYCSAIAMQPQRIPFSHGFGSPSEYCSAITIHPSEHHAAITVQPQ